MNPADRVLELFQTRPTGSNRIDWLANQLLALTVEARALALRLVPDRAGGGWAFEVTASGRQVSTPDAGPVRLFRTLLARFAKMGEEETGAAFNPYAGKLHFDRTGSTGPARIDVEFENTAGIQSLSLVCSARAQGDGTNDPVGPRNTGVAYRSTDRRAST